jgi:signal peptidase II
VPSDAADPRRSPPLTPSRAADRAQPDPAAAVGPAAPAAPPEPSGAGHPHGRPVLAAAIVLGVVVLDQLSKWWAVARLPDDPVRIVGDDVGFVVVRNTGSAFSLFQAFTPLLAIVAIVVAVILVRAVRRTRDTLMVVGLSLVLGGALGNLADRLFRTPGFLKGAVVDFVHVGDFPTFNVADSAITIGAVLIVIWAIRADVRERRAERRAEGASDDG